MTRIATFNVNSIRRRVPHVKRFLARHQPELVFLQELKCRTEEFPALELADTGYRIHAVGQPGGRNGVAVLGRIPFEVTAEALPGEAEDDHARFIAVWAAGAEIAGLYLPNGNSGGEAGFRYKLRWLERLAEWAEARLDAFTPVALLGDFNVCPTEADLAPGALPPTDALVRPESRARFRALQFLGLTDALRALHPQDAPFTYWDYGPAFNMNRGLRIDHILLSAELAERLTGCGVDTDARSEDQPSDHAPVWCDLR
ncbi:exodeoxyribonuclease III [Siccirubricoccus deserti]|uniref:Exodeoxyribonuclease III n=1 Tax=Siccirubricoccus deserti TaxID=2013562 RepID=A0A9X0QZN7_9PROT|nr:exodeoxyribonuclease III [Siccirubricoccus deserti]MBC4015617.1 exodeoxyribonuclease III [Siccirubricoccus deserti]GGC43131.1 exodeoxyribonuclease III [Siccirubricoccus deserti]